MGKRQHKRLAIDHPASVVLEDRVRIDCRIQNFSYGGLFLISSNKGLLDIPPGTVVRIHIQTQRNTKEIKTAIAHTSDSGLGVAFISKEDELLHYLHRISTTENLKQNRDGSSPKQSKMGTREVAIVNWIHSATKRFLKSRYPEFIKSSYNNLFEAANNANSNQAQSSLFDTYNALRKSHDEIEYLFLDNVDSSFKRFSSGSTHENNPAEELFQQSEMELVAKEDFEEWVSVVSLTRNLESGLSSNFHAIENSLSYLTKRYINDEKNPVSPYSLLWSFKKSFSKFSSTLQAKKVLFSSFQSSILGDIGTLYDEINLHLDRQGITQKAQDKSINETQKPTSTQTEANAHTNTHYSKQLTETLSSLLGLAGNKSSPTTNKQSSNAIASKGAVIQSLKNISAVGQRSIIHKLEEQLSRGMSNGPTRIIDNKTRQTIKITEQLLGSLQQDSSLNPEIRGLIDSLKIPLVKEAIDDPKLLNDANHPGHKLLEIIGKLGPYFPAGEENRSSKDLLYQTIEEISKLAEQGAQLDIKQVTSHLEQVIDQRKDNLKSNLCLVAQSCEQDEQYQAARKSIFKTLCSKLTHREIPIIVEQLLHLGWVGLLVNTLSTFGKDDKNVIRLSGVVDLLLDIFNADQLLKPMTTIQSEYLIKVIKDGFAKNPIYADDSNQYLARLEAIFEAGGTKHPDIANKWVKMNKADIKQLLDRQTTPYPEEITSCDIENTWLDLVASINLDDWIVEQRQQGHVRMLNLAWKNAASTRYVFVDGDGKKQLDTEHYNLADMFRLRQCSLLEDSNIPIVERAINRLLKDTFEQIKRGSDTDDLTGLLRRNAFQKKISELLEITNDEGDHHIMLKLDIDQFSAINNLCGHKGGDKLLQTVANIIKNYLPEHASLARIGSDEFGALIKNCSPDQGYHLAETQRRALENLRYTWDETTIPVTTSIGVVHINPDTISATEVMNLASFACQSAINDGGNLTRMYLPTDLDTIKQNRIAPTATIIEETLKEQNLSLFAQPISAVFLGDDEENHYEILLRVKNDDNQWVGPGELIHAAEKCNRMRSIDRWVINKIFAWLENHHQEINNTGISINLSAQTMEDDSFLAFIMNHLNSSPFPNNRVTFEITETSLIKQIDKARTLVENIKRKGCKFSLDDFGTGYATYSYLKDFPVDHVKIDGTFIKDILTERSNYAMVKSITEVSHYMGKKVVAEFVESEAVLVALRELEVDFAQGYYIGHPVPIKNLLQA